MSIKASPAAVTNSQTKPRTTFLTLPHELRQSILHESLDAAFLNDLWPCHISYHRKQPCAHGKKIQAWLINLEDVHLDILDDVRYVGKQWKKAHDAQVAETEEICIAIKEGRWEGLLCE